VRKKIGEMLLESGAVNEEQLREALAVQKQRSVLMGEQLIAQGACDEVTVYRALAKQANMAFVDLVDRTPAERITSLLATQAAYELTALPVAEKDGVLLVAISDPRQAVAVDTLNFLLDREIRLVLASPSSLMAALERVYGPNEARAKTSAAARAEDGDDAPIVRLVNRMFADAVKQRASDIHIEPFANRVRIRFRIDGKLIIADEHPVEVFAPLISHIKVSGGLDIAEKRRPQDGRIEHTVDGHKLDVRVSVLPTNNGQTCVMRLLDSEANLISLADLGMNEDSLKWFSRLIERPSGIFLVTGPTGSGKTTTLYAALQTLNRPDKKILTVEDPVEYRIPGINQVQVHPQIGLTFPRVLRSFLRQAPNVVLVGEIRDRETAEVAIQASLTGHLVFSTVHTNDAPSAVTRLLDMGVPAFLIATSLQGVLAQRLLRRLCDACASEEDATLLERNILSVSKGTKLMRPQGCRQCSGTGYRGRIGAFEWLGLDEEMRETLFQSSDPSDFSAAAESSPNLTRLKTDAIAKAVAGLTTVEEVLRVTKVDSVAVNEEMSNQTQEQTND
jgi:type IV pilus assembly protein PilB